MQDLEILLIEAIVFGVIALLVYIFRDKFRPREPREPKE